MVVLDEPGGGGTFLSHSWSGAFIFMHPAVLEESAAPPPPSTPRHEEAGSGFGVDFGWVGGGLLTSSIQAAAAAVGRRYSTNHFFYGSTPRPLVLQRIVWMNEAQSY